MDTRVEMERLAVACPVCKAQVGEPCRVVRKTGTHVARQDRARRAMERARSGK